MGYDLGMQNLLEAENLAQNAAWCRSLGLDFVELHMSLPGCGRGRWIPACCEGSGRVRRVLHAAPA